MKNWPDKCPACGRGTEVHRGSVNPVKPWHDTTGHCKGCNRHPFAILSFDKGTGLYFLSNFYDPSPVKLLGETYATVEHGYQAAKTKRPSQREQIRNCATAGAAKKAGQDVTLRHDWEEVKDRVMRKLLQQKFAIPELRERLLATHDAFLQEGNHWGDTVWGVCKGKGENRLGILLMQVRQEIRSEA